MDSDFPIKRAHADGCKGWVLYDQFPKPLSILGYFSDRETAEEMAPSLLSLHARNKQKAAEKAAATTDSKPTKRKK